MLQQQNEQMRQDLLAAAPEAVNDQSPLAFKQRLFDAQEALGALAKRRNCSMPEMLGFDDYRSAVPDAGQTAMLHQELTLVERVVRVLMENDIRVVHAIELSHQFARQQDAALAYATVSADVVFDGTSAQLARVLDTLAHGNDSIIFDGMSVQKNEPGSGPGYIRLRVGLVCRQ